MKWHLIELSWSSQRYPSNSPLLITNGQQVCFTTTNHNGQLKKRIFSYMGDSFKIFNQEQNCWYTTLPLLTKQTHQHAKECGECFNVGPAEKCINYCTPNCYKCFKRRLTKDKEFRAIIRKEVNQLKKN